MGRKRFIELSITSISIKHATTNAKTNKFLLSWHFDLEERMFGYKRNKLCATIMIIEMASGFVVIDGNVGG